MTDNPARYGFRWHSSEFGGGKPRGILRRVASAESFDVSGGGSNCTLGPGDLVRFTAGGMLEQADGGENGATEQTVLGVVDEIISYRDPATGRKTFAYLLPSDIAWTNFDDATLVRVIPLEGSRWEVDVNDAVTATTRAAYEALVGENVEYINTGATSGGRMYPKINISTHASSNALQFRIDGVSETLDNQDFSGANVKIIVKGNLGVSPLLGGITGTS